jgi:hypothetical protein
MYYLLSETLGHQAREELSWSKERKLFYFGTANQTHVSNIVRQKEQRGGCP